MAIFLYEDQEGEMKEFLKLLKLRWWTGVHVAVELEPEKDTCPSVRVCVHRSSDTSRHWILPKLGMMLEDNKCRKVTRPFFPGKINLINYS